MALGNLLILTQVIAYLLAVIFALFMFIPIAVNLGQFNSHCLLNAEGHWTGDVLDIDSWGLSANCNFSNICWCYSFSCGGAICIVDVRVSVPRN